VQPGRKIWLAFDVKDEDEIKRLYHIGQRFETLDYEITKIDLKFATPDKRELQCSKMVLAEIRGNN
jgi:hypothetical protein